MLSVLLADDDRLILDHIASRIDWDALGYEIVGKAANGAQALAMLREKRPNLLVIDVVMPLMNGLEVVATARAECPDTCVLVISSYEEFDYVKEAITLGAIGYVLKSELFSAPFRDKLEHIHQDISRDRDSRRAYEHGILERYFSEADDAVGRSGFMSGGRNDAALYSQTGDFALFYEWAPVQLKRGAKEPYDMKLRQERVLAVCDGEVSIERSFFADELLVVGVQPGRGTAAFWRTVAARLSGSFRREYSYVCAPGTLTLSALRDCVQARMNALQFLRHFRPIPALELEALPTFSAGERFNFVAMLDDASDIPGNLNAYFGKLDASMDYETIDDFVKSFALQAEMLSGFEAEVESFRYFDNLDALRIWCLELYERSRRSARRSAEKRYSEPIAQAIEYINQNYANPDLRIEAIAQHSAISMSRLQVLFKKETGKTINDHLTNVRVQEAARLLETTQLRVYEVAEAVGYSSSQYFSQVLLQRTGKKPLEFRRAAKM